MLGLGIGGWLAPCAHAGELGFGIGYLGEYTDNMRLSPTDPREEWTNTAIAGVAYRENAPELAANVLVQVEHRDYTREVYQDETLAYLTSAAVWTIAPRRLLWTFVDRFDELPRNATSAFTPDNRDAVNVFDTGPDFLVPLNPVDVLVFGARVGNTWYKEGDADHNRFAALLRWRHQMDAISQFSFNLEGQKIVYTETPALPSTALPDYLREDYYLRYDRRQTWSRLVLDLGGTHIVPDDAGEDVSESLVRLDLARRLSSDSAFGMSFGREVTNVGAALLAGVADPTLQEPITVPPVIPAELAAGDIYISRRGEAFYSATGHYLGYLIRAYQRDFDYLTIAQIQDRIETGARVQVTYNFTATFTTGVYGEIQKTEFQDIIRLDRDVRYGMVFAYRISPTLSLGLEGSHTERNSSDPLSSYAETRGLVRFIYSSSPLFSPAARR